VCRDKIVKFKVAAFVNYRDKSLKKIYDNTIYNNVSAHTLDISQSSILHIAAKETQAGC